MDAEYIRLERLSQLAESRNAKTNFPATPPTPDLDAVREALVSCLSSGPWDSRQALAKMLQVAGPDGTEFDRIPAAYRIADALLSRLAPRTETYPHDCGCETCGDHTPQAAPEVTEAMCLALIRREWELAGGRNASSGVKTYSFDRAWADCTDYERQSFLRTAHDRLTAALRAGGTDGR